MRTQYKRKTKKKSNRYNKNKPIYFYSHSRIYKEANGKVIENVNTEQMNNKISIKGIINGKRINKTKKTKKNKLYVIDT